MARSTAPSTRRPRTKTRRTAALDQYFSSYISFGLHTTVCVGCFFILYILVLVCLVPMLDQANQASESLPNGPLDGARLPHAPGQEKLAQAASAMRKKLRKIRKGKGVSDESLLEAAIAEFEVLQAKKKDKNQQQETGKLRASHKKDRAGFVVLGMHRSGTSMLSGLLVTGMGYNVGGPLIQPNFDNEKGFFERIDVVLQNDEFFSHQNIGWSFNMREYDYKLALKQKRSGEVKFKEGERALRFLNDSSNAPWLQKDPRMSIALKTWLELLNTEPAAVFTYRHPLEVAMSLHKREDSISIEHGLRMWIVYNQRAIENSAGLCRVFTSNEEVLSNPLEEVKRVSKELTQKCGVPSPPKSLTEEEVEKFVDAKLVHNKNKAKDKAAAQQRVLATHGDCEVRDEISDKINGSFEGQRAMDLYLKAMKMYCDFKSGEAYKDGYVWPTLP
mmetsp:Transcript_29045/g.40686  ORF Transcript_29045/g.40686 Transcript_29045/m.40686 type:complete len:445 (-) Transcript_29045:33-1367(-)